MKKVLSVMSLLLMLLALSTAQPAQARKVYLNPNGWTADNARFAAWVWADGVDGAWYDFVAAGGGVYVANIDNAYTGLAIVRMNPETTENDWANKWNQSADINIADNDNTLLTINDNEWEGAGVYTTYFVDFNTSISTSQHDFAVASNWKHIVGENNYDTYGPYYMSYSYYSSEGLDGTGTLLPFRQYGGDYGGGGEITDLLVTPLISGKVTLFVKPSGLASSSNPSYVEFYNVNDAGTEAGDLIQRFTEEDGYEASEEYEGWYTVSLNIDEPKRVGIRVQYSYIDNFYASFVTLTKEAKLTVTGLATTTGSTPYYVSQNENGGATVTLNVTLTNNGEVDFKAGETENYTLTLVQKAYYGSTQTVLENAKFTIDEDILVGESKTVEATFDVDQVATGWTYWKVREDITGSISSAQIQSQVQEYASKFIFDKSGSSYYSSSSATTTPISFGKITEDATVNYEIYNSGSAPLVINSFTVPAGYTTDAPQGEFTVAAGEKYQIAISLSAETPGIFAGNVEVVYTNYGKAQATYTLAISGTVVDPSKNIITFDNGENGAFPAGSIHSDQVYVSSETVNDVVNYYLTSTSTVTKFITPLLTAEAGESFTYDAWYGSYNSSAAVTVYISKDRQNWTQVSKQTYSTLSNTAKTFAVTIDEAGDYYLAFEFGGSNTRLDNIYGLTLAEAPAHDLYVTASNIPASGKQNHLYEASIAVHNIAATADVIESATLYVNDEPVAVTENVTLAANEKTAAVGTGRNNYSNIENPVTINFQFVPHFNGSKNVRIELKSDDEVVYSTDVVEATFAEEVYENEPVVVGDGGSVAYQNAPIDFFNYEQAKTSDILYTAAQLAAFGINEGDVITKLAFKANASSKTISKSSLTAWVGLSEGIITYGEPDKESLTEVVVYNPGDMSFTSGETWVNINLENPIVYDGTSDIRIYLEGGGEGEWIKLEFAADNNYMNMKWSNATSMKANPVLYVTVAAEPTTLTGTVFDGEAAVEGATVTLYAPEADVLYSGVTAADGSFSIGVIQDDLTYNVTVSAEGYDDQVFEAVNLSEPLNVNFSNEVAINITAAGWATFSSTQAVELPEGVTAYVATATKDGGASIELVELADRVVPANTGVLLEGAAGEYTANVVQTGALVAVENLLVAVNEDYTVNGVDEGYVYVFGQVSGRVGFVQGKAGYTIPAGKAYLRVGEALAGKAFIGFGETTGINGVSIDALDGQATYNLNGQRVNASQRGVVIRGGKKYIVK